MLSTGRTASPCPACSKPCRLQIDPILADLEGSLSRLSDADTGLSEELQKAEKDGIPIRTVGASYLEVFRTLGDEIENCRNRMNGFVPPPSLRVYQMTYVRALDKCMQSVSFRIKSCEYIVEGDGAEAEKALRRAKSLTGEFIRIEEQAIKSMQ